MSNKGTVKSKCCNAKVEISIHGEHLTTKCCKCGKDCIPVSIPRKTWNRNPSTQVQQNTKAKKKKQFTNKELRELHLHEDF